MNIILLMMMMIMLIMMIIDDTCRRIFKEVTKQNEGKKPYLLLHSTFLIISILCTIQGNAETLQLKVMVNGGLHRYGSKSELTNTPDLKVAPLQTTLFKAITQTKCPRIIVISGLVFGKELSMRVWPISLSSLFGLHLCNPS